VRTLLQGAECICSALVLVEVPRVLTRRRQRDWQDGWRLLRAGLRVVDLGRPVVERAAVLPPAGLRTLDALHLATALIVGPTDGLVAYDLRLLDAAAAAGLAVQHPGLVRA
jgi:predicted nucleic acid-binding protein